MTSSMMAASQVAFEPRDFMHAENYPSMDEHHHVPGGDGGTFADPHQAVANDLADGVNYSTTVVPDFDATHNDLDLDTPPPPPPPPPPQHNVRATPPPTGEHLQQVMRMKVPAKPSRVGVKNAEGKFVCTVEDCQEEVRAFARKCEWSKHMDKHERPYPCLENGCEKLPGFTYAGGLLRHEREVHGKHGGPKKQITCPHPTCKRYAGKPFSRQENLNEHLRRCHTMDAADGQPQAADNDIENTASPGSTPPPRAGQKRKRPDDDDAEAVRQENERLRQENNELRQQVHNLKNQLIAHLQQQLEQATAINIGNGTLL